MLGAPSMFEQTFRPLSDARPGFGALAELPWDAETFGFNVAELRDAEAAAIEAAPDGFAAALRSWAKERSLRLVSAAVPLSDGRLGARLEAAGFRLAEVSIRASHGRLSAAPLPKIAASVRPAEPADFAEVERIARSAFQHGRYHADWRFPRRLADERYARWVARACRQPQPEDRVLVTGKAGAPAGFFHVAVRGELADLRLGGVDPERAGPLGGAALYAATLRHLAAAGCRRATARLSCANLPVLNLYAGFGFRFDDPRAVFHWHAPAPEEARG